MKSEPVYYATPKPRQISQQGAVRLMSDILADQKAEITKLRKLLVVKLCDCRRMTNKLPLEPAQHSLTCRYRRDVS